MASRRPFQVIPVLDLQGGQIVRGVAGQRQEYRPIVSRLTSSSDPVEVAEAFRRGFGFTDLYLADLDAIAGAPPALGLCRELQVRGFRLWVDPGVRGVASLDPWLAADVSGIVVGLETIDGPEALADVSRLLGNRMIFSLDLKAGTPLTARSWKKEDVWGIATLAVQRGVRRLLAIDLAYVGTGIGPGTEQVCAALAGNFRHVEVFAGGGVRGVEDLVRLREQGVHGALIATALHDGKLTREQLATL